MSANITPFNSDGGFTTAGNITGGTGNLSALNMSQSVTWPGGSSIYEDSGIVVQGTVGVLITSPGTTQITAGSNTWSFDTSGNLTTPGISGNITGANVISANTFITNSLVGDGNLYLQPDANTAGAYLDIYLTNGPDVHIAGNSENVIIGRDSGANVMVGADGNVAIQANAIFGGASHTWMFDYTGNLNLPGGHASLGISNSGYLTTLSNDSTSVAVDGDNGIVTVATNGGGTTYTFVDNFNATSSANVLSLTTRNGDSNPVNSRPQIVFGYNGTTDYPQFIHTIHNAGTPVNNRIEFWTSDGTQAGTFPANAVLGLTVTNGNIATGGILTDNYYYANGIPVSFGSSNYGNANVANFLANFGSNVLSTTGNVVSGNISATGNITASGLLIDTVTGITSNAGNININQITGLGGYLNAYGANLSGNINAVNLSLLGNIISDANISGNVNAANISAGNISLSGNIFAYGANIYSVNGLTMEGGNLTMSSITGMGGSISAEGNITGTNLSATGNVSGQNINGGNLSLSGNVLSNLNIQQGNISVSGNITSGSELTVVSANITGVQGLTVSGGDITIPSSMSGGSLSAYGNITGSYILGNGSQLTGIQTTSTEPNFTIQTGNFSATVGSRYGVNTVSNTVTATLPASPATGGAIFFADAGGAFATNNLTINPNGGTIMGASGNMTVSTNNQSFGLFYNGTTWRTYNAG